MIHLAVISNSWETSKEGRFFTASKNIKIHFFNETRNLIVKLKTNSLKILNQLMVKTDREKALEMLINSYEIGTANTSVTLMNSGELLIENLNRNIEKHHESEHRPKDHQAFNILGHPLKQKEEDLNENQTSITIALFEEPAAFLPAAPLSAAKNDSFYAQITLFFKQFQKKIKTLVAHYFKNITPPPAPEIKRKVGLAALLENFEATGERKNNITKPGWLHDQILPRIFLRAVNFAIQDREELRERKEAALSFSKREKNLTMSERRGIFENSFLKKYPNFLTKHLTIKTVDHIKLDTFIIFNHRSTSLPPEEQRWIVFFHPGDVAYEETLWTLIQISNDTGANVYTGNYRGVGSSQGLPTCSNDLILDGKAMVQYLLNSGILPHHILIHGSSIGGGVATEIVAQHPGMHLCNDRSFTKYTEAAHELAPNGFKKFTANRTASMGWEFDSLHHLENITGYVLIIGSSLDGKILGKANLAHWIGDSTGIINHHIIWLTEKYLDEPNEIVRAMRAHCDPITLTSKYSDYLRFVQKALKS